jgi:hypothetical protein
MKIPEIKTPAEALSTKEELENLREEFKNLQTDHENLNIKFRKLHSRVIDVERENLKMTDKIIRKARRSIMPICGFNFGMLFALALIHLGLIYMIALTIFALVLKLISDITNVDNPLLDGMTLGYLIATIITSMGYLIAFLIG